MGRPKTFTANDDGHSRAFRGEAAQHAEEGPKGTETKAGWPPGDHCRVLGRATSSSGRAAQGQGAR